MTHPWRTGTVASGGEEIYYEVIGDDAAPAILLTHGAGGCHAIWYQQVPALADAGYRVVTWDCRGFGNSTFRTGTHGADAAASDMTAILDALGIARVHLAGQSMGGWWVTAFALAHPERVQSLTMSNTVGGLWNDALDAHFKTFVASAPGSDPARLGVHSALSPTLADATPPRAFLYQQLNTFQPPPMAEVARALIGTRIDPAALDATQVPILVITSSDDQLFPAPLVVDTAARLANATIVEIAGAGHSAYFERPDAYNDALIEFVAQHTP